MGAAEPALADRFHVTGSDPATGEAVDLWIHDGRFVAGPVRAAVELRGFVLPGFVDAHCHIGYDATGAVDLTTAEEQARTNLAAGVLAIRDCGSPIDTRPLVGRADLPLLVRAGRHIARRKRYIRELGVDVEPEQLVEEVRAQAGYGGGWVKIVGDWIDRARGDLAPLWPTEILTAAVTAAHELGVRVTTHVFGEDAVDQMLRAGVDCVEHGTGLTGSSIELAAERGVRLVPTMINVENFPAFAGAAVRFPRYAAHMRELHARSRRIFTEAAAAGVRLLAGTDAGGSVAHGRIADEVIALMGVHADPRRALCAAGVDARDFLGLPGWQIGSAADLVLYDADPALEPEVLHHPRAVFRSGLIRAGVLG